MKYNYVLFGSPEDYYKVSYSELYDLPGAHCIMDGLDSGNQVLQILFKLHTSKKTQEYIDLPLKSIWNKLIFKNPFNDNKPICFVFFPRNPLCNKNVINYLRQHYPNSKFVGFWQDLVGQIKLPDFEEMRDNYLDICLSFDQGDCLRYGLSYYPLVYSYYGETTNHLLPHSDVYYVGRAKDRLKTIIDIYELLSNSGLVCDFNITGVKKKDQVFPDSIKYLDSMPYVENIEHIKATNCILEIMQGGGTGFTLRYAEAIMYDKKMITNNQAIREASFYSPSRINVFKEIKDIDLGFPIAEPIIADYGFKDNLLPSKMLQFIDDQL